MPFGETKDVLFRIASLFCSAKPMSPSAAIACLVVLSFSLGYVRDLLVAWRFGGSWVADSLFVALMLPVFFENLLGVALRDAVIPHLQALRLQGATILQQQFQRLQAVVWMGGLVVTAIVALGAPLWLAMLMPGWGSERVEEFIPTFQLAGALIAAQTVLYFQTAVFNAGGRFLLPMTRTVLLNLGAIVALAYTTTTVGLVVTAMLMGQLLLLGVMQTRLKELVVARVPADSGTAPGGPSLIGYFVPLLIVAAAQQVCFVVERVLGSYMAEGSIAHLSYAFRIGTIPLTLFALSSLALIYPAFTVTWLDRRDEHFAKLLHQALSVTFVFLAPAAALLSATSSDVISLLLERGAFGAEQTAAASPLLTVYGIGLPAMGLTLLTGRILIAMQKGAQYAVLTVMCSLLIVAIDLAIYRSHGAFGLAVGYVVGNWLQALVSVVLIARHTPKFNPWGSMLRWAGASLLVYWTVLTLAPTSSWPGLLLSCVFAFIACLALVFGMGERHILQARFWRMALGNHTLESPIRE